MADLSVGNWIPSCQSLRSHSKRKRLSRRLGIGLHETVGLLICLWWWAIDEGEDGDLTRFSDQDIADGADWEGEADQLVAALVDAGFLSEGRALVNWSKYVGQLIVKRNYKREVERQRQARYRKEQADRLASAGSHDEVTRDSHGTGDIVAGDSPASRVAVARDAQQGGQDTPSGAFEPTPNPPEPPEVLAEFDARLRKMPGYNPSADFYRLVLEKYSRLDLNEQAFLMTEWQGDPQRNKKKRKGTTLFVVSWLKRTLADAPIQFAARAGGQKNRNDGGALVAATPDDTWDDAMLLDDDDPPPGIDLDGAFGGTDGELERVGGLHLFRRTIQRIQRTPTEGTQAELILMRTLPSVDQVRDQLAELRGAVANLPGEVAFDLDRMRMGRRVTELEKALTRCQRRDRIAASRPPGCWCLGAGGEGERGILPAGRAKDGAEPFETFVRYCECEEGTDAERAAIAAQHQHDRWVIDSRRERIWGQAKVPSIYDGLTLETWIDEVVRRGGDREQATSLIRGLRRWLETKAWLLLLGPPSTGKTGIAIALMWELAGRGIGVYFVNASDMVMRIRGTFDRPDQSEVEMFDSLAEVPVLVIDDLGKQAMTPYARELFYRLFNARWGNGLRTIVPSNLAKADALKAHVGEAVYDRLIQVAKVARVDPGVNLRLPRREHTVLR